MPPQVMVAAPTGVRAPVPSRQLLTSPSRAGLGREPLLPAGARRAPVPAARRALRAAVNPCGEALRLRPPLRLRRRRRAQPPRPAAVQRRIPSGAGPGRAVQRPPRAQRPPPPRAAPVLPCWGRRAGERGGGGGERRARRLRTARPLAARAAVTSCPCAHPAPGSAAAALAGQGRIKFYSGRGKPAVLSQVGARPRRPARRALPLPLPAAAVLGARCHLPAARPPLPARARAWRGGGRARLRLLRLRLRQRRGGRRPGGRAAAAGCRGRSFHPPPPPPLLLGS